MIRELAENPNVHQTLSAGRELLTDPAGRFAIYLSPGLGAHSATVQRVRLAPEEVPHAVEEIRCLLRARGRGGAEWELGESCTPADLIDRLGALGIVPDEAEPVAIGMVLESGDELPAPPGVLARPIESVDELVLARRIQDEAFGDNLGEEAGYAQAEADFAREAAARGTPVLVTHAGKMSRPILERLGFKPVARIDRLLDVLSD